MINPTGGIWARLTCLTGIGRDLPDSRGRPSVSIATLVIFVYRSGSFELGDCSAFVSRGLFLRARAPDWLCAPVIFQIWT